MMSKPSSLVLPIAAFLVGCASSGTRPHDMSAAEHRSAAEREEQAALEHAALYDPDASGQVRRCSKPHVCWTSRSNPTRQHAEDAKTHRELAAKHRAASAALVAAESRACAGIEPEERDISPFYHREDIVSVEPVYHEAQREARLRGAKVVFREVPGLTPERLQRQVECHLARASAAGHVMPEMSYCPLMLRDVKAEVARTSSGIGVLVSSDDPETSNEILQRAQTLVTTAPSSGTASPGP